MNNVKPPQQVEDNDKRPHHPRAENNSEQNSVSKNKKGKDPLSVITPQPTVISNSPGSAVGNNKRGQWTMTRNVLGQAIR
jgi:hypothetical protein